MTSLKQHSTIRLPEIIVDTSPFFSALYNPYGNELFFCKDISLIYKLKNLWYVIQGNRFVFSIIT
ncbi:MAG: hypothetical protein KAW47_05720 [Thermoplasmatales archaeon]|nr:hypothetical protein [Thermoplasmatales archaeon]